eukprot:CAMPEP_0198135496 /NCGR_PEP_ID=MMETSP1442-20131203/60621_1 /TAXON_ID= /ORGANISM="Craspedostauros australis, Strain CCMP3328" /LENGTH=220 /DNA_ID=CAMNT_0043796669 /DNA_START=141 /DNA_END=803 /DNA_ORIENTATION=-
MTMATAGLACTSAFVPQVTPSHSTTQLRMGWFDNNFKAGGSGRDDLDEQWEAQQEILKRRNKPKAERDAYFAKIEDRREEASKKQNDMWAWQSKSYKKGEDPIDEWKKRRKSGQISDLNDQYGDPKKVGGIPMPMASFGVGGEFGVGGKFDNGGRFDLRLPYAEQGYVDDDADFMGKLFGKNKKKQAPEAKDQPKLQNKKQKQQQQQKPPQEKKKGGWPW